MWDYPENVIKNKRFYPLPHEVDLPEDINLRIEFLERWVRHSKNSIKPLATTYVIDLWEQKLDITRLQQLLNKESVEGD